MPELPEVEVARQAIEPHLSGQLISDAICRTPRLRTALDPELGKKLRGNRIHSVARRGKYLLLECRGTNVAREGDAPPAGWLIIHLGMSGSLRLCPANTPPHLHDHFDLVLGQQLLRLHDPRRFGAVVWHTGEPIEANPLLARLGPEPFADQLDGNWLHHALNRRHGPIKPALMDNHLLVGVGNIYASESLFRAGISPLRAADRISRPRCDRLLVEIRATLTEAIAAGGSTLRDYVHTDGGSGCFQFAHSVYEREGQPCLRCKRPIRLVRQAGRSTYYCPGCQR
jgi:formamidopyrimidine-DNA glycosylase